MKQKILTPGRILILCMVVLAFFLPVLVSNSYAQSLFVQVVINIIVVVGLNFITGLNVPTHQVVKQGIVYVPEGREVFPAMSVFENLEMGAYSHSFGKKELNDQIEKMYDIFPRLKERSKQLAGSLSGGEQQMLAIARGLMSGPKLIMFDEPSLGLAPLIVDDMFKTILRINQEMQIPIVIVEQNAFMAMSISSRTYVLEVGKITTAGSSAELLDSPKIKKAYLGG